MAKAKAMVSNQVADVIPTLDITPKTPAAVGGNFEDVAKYLEKMRDRYVGMDFLSASPDELQKVKQEFRSYRTALERTEKSMNQQYFTEPKKALAGMFARLYSLISAVEAPVDEGLKKLDQVRLDQIDMAIDAYIEEFQAEYKLDGEMFLPRVEKKDKYYNKTQSEADTRNDIEAQFAALAKAQKAFSSAFKLITKACDADARLNKVRYLKRLEQGEEAASILDEIEEEKERLEALDTEQKEAAEEIEEDVEDEEAEDEKVSLGVPDKIDLSSDLPARKKEVLVKIKYPAELSDALSELFEQLWDKGIEAEIVKTAVDMF